MAQKDNGSRQLKSFMRHELMKQVAPLAVLETHGGSGAMYNDCYRAFPGVVIEKNECKAESLAEQRHNWAVYEGAAEKVLESGACFHLPINYIDIDPYGEPWPVIDAVFARHKDLPSRWGLVVNDGLRRFLMLGRAWKYPRLKKYVERYGNQNIAEVYPQICHEMIEEKAHACGMSLDWWMGRSGGHGGQMTHYAAVILHSKGLA